MQLKNLTIGTQLKLGFAIVLLFVMVLGTVCYLQTEALHQQTQNMYDHPFKVQYSLNSLNGDIFAIRHDIKDMFLTSSEKELSLNLNRIEKYKLDAFDMLDVIDNQYLGPHADVVALKQAFAVLNSMHDETIHLLRAGKTTDAVSYSRTLGPTGRQAEVVLAALHKIDEFSRNKAGSLYANSEKVISTLHLQLFLVVVTILIISVFIFYLLRYNIHTPLNALTIAARLFHNGDLNARSSYESGNEFGLLSSSFNALAENIQQNFEFNEKAAGLTGLMLNEYDAKILFQAMLNSLAACSGSQMAAIYLLSSDKKSFDHFESMGVDGSARQSFASDSFEGEFGNSLYSRKVQHIKDIAPDTRFVFHTVNGTFVPNEIITLPIVADNQVIAVISLATVGSYSAQSIHLINNIQVALSARIEGILGYHKIKEFSERMEIQNCELETQKSELAAQTTELKVQNTELEMQKKQLDEVSRLKTNFLSNMSHELRTPLNSVIALSGVLNRRLAAQIPEEEYSYLGVIERNGKHLLALINDILDISRIESGREEIEVTQFNANSLIAEVVDLLQPQAQQKNIELLHSNRETSFVVTSDAVKCRHILQNLIGNAVKFTEAGSVDVGARQNGKNIEITINDTGIGIEEAHIAHIFDEFRQADGSTSRRFGGTGLGLAIAGKYAHLLGGSITVTSKLGSGSQFTLFLPLRHAVENRVIEACSMDGYTFTNKQAPRTFTPDSGSKTILLVEDSDPAIVQLKDILEESGYNILVARDGDQALDIIDHTIPDAMVLDLMMPGTDGFKVLQTIREAERTAHIPVLILTAKHITKEELRFLKRNNIHQHIQKGDVNRTDLLSSVAAMVYPETMEAKKPLRERQKIDGSPVVLIVEDNPDNMITAKALLAENYTAIGAIDGKDGVEMARQHKPHLILMDISLPGMDGIETFLLIRSDPQLQRIPVIALTASAMTSDRETILAYGFDAYIPKPVDEGLFFKTLNEVLYGE